MFLQITFRCDSYGVYPQRFVLSFDGQSEYLCRELNVTVRREEITSLATDLSITEGTRWETLSDVEIVRFPR